jgi:hypothetical protein
MPARVPSRRRDGVVTRWNRFCFRFWGPPTLGDLSAPQRPIDPDPPCPHCSHRESEHQTFGTRDGKVLRRCPA